jgi:hypothetical protein
MSAPKPITNSLYQRHTESYWRGREVTTLVEITTFGGLTYPAGSRAIIDGKLGGFRLKGTPCPCCGVVLHLSKVAPYKLALVDESPLLNHKGAAA